MYMGNKYKKKVALGILKVVSSRNSVKPKTAEEEVAKEANELVLAALSGAFEMIGLVTPEEAKDALKRKVSAREVKEIKATPEWMCAEAKSNFKFN